MHACFGNVPSIVTPLHARVNVVFGPRNERFEEKLFHFILVPKVERRLNQLRSNVT